MQQAWRKWLLLSALAFMTGVSIPSHLYGQQLSATRGGLGGVVTDKSGAVIPGAKVTLSGAADHRIVTTDSAGRFIASDLTPGMYSASVEKAGFQSQTAKNLEVVINKTNSVDFALATGNVAETVEVNATTVSIDTSSTAVSDNLTATFYQQVPIARNIGSLFYVSPGVVDGGGTGTSNPSVGGATGLENLYLVDGVVLNDSGYGGLGVYSPVYGSLGTGINLSFIQEVQVKTAAYEPKYGGVNGGVLQIVTKSGGTKLHGALAGYVAPAGASAGFKYADNYRLFAGDAFQRGKITSLPAYDASVELGGFIPVKGSHDRLFYFGSFNPSLNQANFVAANTAFAASVYQHGPFASSATTRSWAGKLSLKITDATTLEASAFGDPAHNNYSYNRVFTAPPPYPQNINIKNTTGFSAWAYGSRAIVTHLASSLNPTTQLNIAATYKTSNFTESGYDNIYNVSDRTVGSQVFQGLNGGIFQNPMNKSYGSTIDIQKIVNLFGPHTFSGGFGFNRATYLVDRDYIGSRFAFPSTNADGVPIENVGGSAGLAGVSTSAAFYLQLASSNCPTSLCPFYNTTAGRKQVYLSQVRGIFSGPTATSNQSYLTSYVNDSWAVNRRVTINAGLRWEEEQLNGPNQQYVFNDNWSPRLGINIDPFADRKTKIYFNWGRYTQALPTDAAIRELNQELDINSARWAAPSDGTNLLTNADGTITPTLDSAHLLSGIKRYANSSTSSGPAGNIAASSLTPELIHGGTRLNFEEEYLLGFQREVASGMVLDVRYSDRRLQRIVEDMQGVSPEGANFGLPNQIYLIGNPSPAADYFTNEVEEKYTPTPDGGGQPANCVADYGPQADSLGNTVGAACGQNPDTAGLTVPDGKPDGFARPVRRYQSLEVELNKNFSQGFLIRANYRFAKLYGNYEGLFRNDNGQSDPGISSLFDFTQGVVGLLGAQFTPGYLNTDRRNVGNLYGSYTLPNGMFRKLTGGMGLRGQTGNPISRLASHPVYHDVGEIPIGGRGTAGTSPTALQLDLHADYPVTLGDKGSLKLAFDGFNVTNSQFTRTVNQYLDTGFQTGADPTFGSPTTFQRAFYGRFSVRYEF
jgi:Carboxypeptidase regulatory-like domain